MRFHANQKLFIESKGDYDQIQILIADGALIFVRLLAIFSESLVGR